MGIVTFTRTAACRIPLRGPISWEMAELCANTAIKAGNIDCQFQADDFLEIEDIPDVCTALNGKCFGGPLELAPRSIDIVGGFSEHDCGQVCFEVSQNCVYFAPGTDMDRTVALAIAASNADEVDTSIEVDASVPNKWVISAPNDIPQSVLYKCVAGYRPMCNAAQEHSSVAVKAANSA